MNISNYIEKTYENQTLGNRGKNKPNQTQFRTRALFTQSFQLSLGKIPRLAPFGISSLPFCTISNSFYNRLYFNNLQENTQKNPRFSPKNPLCERIHKPPFLTQKTRFFQIFQICKFFSKNY
jgi:hypothetical protein